MDEEKKWLLTAYVGDRTFWYGPFDSYELAVEKAVDIMEKPVTLDLAHCFEKLAQTGSRKKNEFALIDPQAIEAMMISEVS